MNRRTPTAQVRAKPAPPNPAGKKRTVYEIVIPLGCGKKKARVLAAELNAFLRTPKTDAERAEELFDTAVDSDAKR